MYEVSNQSCKKTELFDHLQTPTNAKFDLNFRGTRALELFNLGENKQL